MSSTKHGNNKYWCFLDENDTGKEVAVWTAGSDDEPIVIARGIHRYFAVELVDALILKENVEKDRGVEKFGPKELAFLDFVKNHCDEPYATMASSAEMWNDWDRYKELRDKFPQIYR